MPTHSTSKLPMPKSWEEFEHIVSDIIKILWKDNFAVRNGRVGQRQNGVDIYGKPTYLDGNYSGVQCKNKEITLKEIEIEIEKSRQFKPKLKEFIIATTSKKDAKIQEEIRIKDLEFLQKDGLSLKIIFWEDILLILSDNENLILKHFPQFSSKNITTNKIKKTILDSNLSDWKVDDENKVFIYKKDVNLRIEKNTIEDIENFQEPWLKKFPDSRGHVNHHKIFYGNSFIEKIWIVEVDGGRCLIPYPDEFLKIDKYEYKLGKIINNTRWINNPRYMVFDSYLKKAGIKIGNGRDYIIRGV